METQLPATLLLIISGLVLVQGQTRSKVDPHRCYLANGQVILSGFTFSDNCSICRCNRGILICREETLKGCIYFQDETTPLPPMSCPFEKGHKVNGEVFPAQDGCNECFCMYGQIECVVKGGCK